MSRPLRVVKPGDGDVTDMTMAEAIQDLCAKVIAAKPVTVMIAYEVPSDKPDAPSAIKYQTIPSSGVIAGGFVDQLYARMHPDPEIE